VQIADEGNAVIMGRGSQYILRTHPECIHILLVDDFDNRVARVEKREKATREQAARIVANQDKRRLSLYHQLGKQDYDNPSLYHLVLNMARLSLENALDLVCSLAESRSPFAPGAGDLHP
jgi:cytidylate kinase